jgi:hypothetical protein
MMKESILLKVTITSAFYWLSKVTKNVTIYCSELTTCIIILPLMYLLIVLPVFYNYIRKLIKKNIIV